ncbi:calcium-transporting ATPase 12, plasma membrane-type [Salix suchowensis]|nr:calcium-transporting ATPase 12, plasma membrane-type [Salix suchowensis]
MTSSSETSREMDPESLEIGLLGPEIPAPRNVMRSAILFLRAGHIFYSKKETLESAGVLLLSPSRKNLEIAAIQENSPTHQVSLDVPRNDEVGNATSDIKLIHENIASIVTGRDLDSLHAFGGVRGIAEALGTDLESGIDGEGEDLRRRRANAEHKTPVPAARNFLELLMKSSNRYTIFLLIVSAALSLGFGIKEEGPGTGWYEGVLIILAIIILVIVPAVRDFLGQNSENLLEEQKQYWRKREMEVNVLRAGIQLKITAIDLVIGDIVSLERGCPVPGDGLFVSGEHLKLDGSSHSVVDEQNPFLFYGAKVIEGEGNMLVTSMGLNTALGEMISKASKRRLLVHQLHKVTNRTEIAGLATSILILVVLFLRFKLGKKIEGSSMPELKGQQKTKDVMEFIKRIVWKPNGKISTLTTCLTTFLVGVVEGVPFFIRLAISYWNKKIPSTEAVVQEQLTGVTMGSVTVICIDKTSWLTMNPVEVDECWIDETLIGEDSAIPGQVKDAFRIGISTSSSNDQESLISWCARKFGMNMESFKRSHTISEMKELSPGEEGNGVLVREKKGNETKKFVDTEKTLKMCSRYYNSEGEVVDMDTEKMSAFETIIKNMQSKDLKTIAIAYNTTQDETPEDDSLILIGLLGLKDKWLKETKEAVKACRNAGVNIILVSEDSESVTEDIAEKYGMPGGSGILEHGGETFRSFSDEQRKDVVNKICVMGNSLPSDKLLLVRCLKQQDHVVAFVGFRTDDAPSLKEADVGIVTGTGRSELVNGSSELIILDGNLGFLVSILKGGRCIYGNIHKYIQVEVTIAISGLLISTVTTIFFGYAPMSSIQMIWVNLVMAVLGGLALLTEPPSEKLMEKSPTRPTEPLITKSMWRNIIIQASYQVSILLAFQFKGRAILNIDEDVSKAMIFSSFLLCQLSNQFNASEQKLSSLVKGVHQNLWFWVATVLTVVLQVVFIEISHDIFGFARLNGPQWGVCFLIGALSCVTDGAVNITWGFIKVKLTRSNSLGGSELPRSTSILELPLITQNSSSTSVS